MHYHIVKSILLFFVLVAPSMLVARQMPINIDSHEDIITFSDEHILMLEDTLGKLQLEEIQELPFSPKSNYAELKDRNKEHIWWFKISVKNNLTTNKTWWLPISGQYVTAYILQKGKPTITYYTGNLVPNNQKAIPALNKFLNYIPLELSPSRPVEVLLRIKFPETLNNQSHDIQYLKTPLFAQSEYQQGRQNGYQAFIHTALWLLALYCLIYFIQTRARFAIYMLAFCLIGSFHYLNIENYLYEWGITSNHPVLINYLMIGLINIIIFFELMMIRNYLDLKSNLPKWDKVFYWLIIGSIAFLILGWVAYYFTQDFHLAFSQVNGIYQLIYLVARVIFIIAVFRKAHLPSFRMMGIALTLNVIFVAIAFSGHIIFTLDGGAILQLGTIVYVLTLVISLGNDAASNYKEKIQSVQTQYHQQIQLERQQFQLKTTQQQEILAKQKAADLEKVDEMKNRFFVNVSHELRTPLTLIISPLRKALTNNQISLATANSLLLAQKNANRLLRLVNEILDLAKMEATKLEVDLKEVLFFPFIKRLVTTFDSYAEQEGILLSFNYHLDKELLLVLDDSKVETIITNLVANALKFTPKGGTITVSVFSNEDKLHINVEDTGMGIHSEDLPFIFDRFYRSSKGDTPEVNGLGIGLALAKELAELMDGTLTAESELKKGAQFTFICPMRIVDRVLTEIEKSLITEKSNHVDQTFDKIKTLDFDESKKQKATILIVEDNRELRNYIQSTLSEFYRTLTASNGLAALDILTEIMNSENLHLPDLIISDVKMPVMDGYQFLKAIKSKDYFRHIPTIMLTARADMEGKLQALRLGIDDYMLKPFYDEELIARIGNILDNTNQRKSWLAQTEEVDDVVNREAKNAENTIQISADDMLWLEDVEALLQNNLDNSTYKILDLANALHLSKRQVERKIKQLTGLTAGSYLKEIRYSEARRLLESREIDSIKILLTKVGIKDSRNFSQQFQKRFGKLPSEYIK